MTDEVLPVDIKYDPAELYHYFKESLSLQPLEDIPLTYLDQYKEEDEEFNGVSIRDLKSHLKEKGIVSQPRTDLISHPDHTHKSIAPIIEQISKLNLSTGLIAFFMQYAKCDVPVHIDFPYRKNCLLMLPIFYKEFQPTEAITYYENGGSYKITSPVIMNVMKRHGVKNISKDRLMLHIELPDVSFEKLEVRS